MYTTSQFVPLIDDACKTNIAACIVQFNIHTRTREDSLNTIGIDRLKHKSFIQNITFLKSYSKVEDHIYTSGTYHLGLGKARP